MYLQGTKVDVSLTTVIMVKNTRKMYLYFKGGGVGVRERDKVRETESIVHFSLSRVIMIENTRSKHKRVQTNVYLS